MIVLEKFNKDDYDRLINWVDSEKLMIQFSGTIFEYPLTHEQLDNYLTDENRLVYKVIDASTHKVIGHAELNIDPKNNNASICRVLIGDASDRNKGFGKMIIKELINLAFSDLHLHRLHLGVFSFNFPAIRCYKECGFVTEGLLRDTTRFGNEYWSLYNMSMINGVK